MRKMHRQQVNKIFVVYRVSLVITPFYEQVYWIYLVSILDVKRTKQDFLRHKGKSSSRTLRNYTHVFTNIEKFCLRKYDSSFEKLKKFGYIENLV